MGVKKQPELEDWTAFAGDYIKAEFIKEFPVKLVCIKVYVETEDNRHKLLTEVEYNGRVWKFDLNKTNQAAIRLKNLMPKDIVGKVITCISVKARNPTSGLQVDSLLITDIE
jgi:hypothetical protein